MEFKELIGKTIKEIKKLKVENYDNEGFLNIIFTDGTDILIVGDYYGYTGESISEYPTFIEVYNKNEYVNPELDEKPNFIEN